MTAPGLVPRTTVSASGTESAAAMTSRQRRPSASGWSPGSPSSMSTSNATGAPGRDGVRGQRDQRAWTARLIESRRTPRWSTVAQLEQPGRMVPSMGVPQVDLPGVVDGRDDWPADARVAAPLCTAVRPGHGVATDVEVHGRGTSGCSDRRRLGLLVAFASKATTWVALGLRALLNAAPPKRSWEGSPAAPRAPSTEVPRGRAARLRPSGAPRGRPTLDPPASPARWARRRSTARVSSECFWARGHVPVGPDGVRHACVDRETAAGAAVSSVREIVNGLGLAAR